LSTKIRNHLEPFDGDGFLLRKKGALRGRYLTAYNKLVRSGVNLGKDSDISAFVKLERYYEEGKAPRMIMGRNPKFNILYAQLIEPIEKAFFKLPQVANACDHFKCGERFSQLVGDWFMENDMSKFEGSQRWLTLKLEYRIYLNCFPDKKNLLDLLFAYKTMKCGDASDGVSFSFKECRGSGDMDTSLGNGLLNYIATQYYQMENFCPDCRLADCKLPTCFSYSFTVKGDDSYAKSRIGLTNVVNTYKLFGFDAKIIIRKSSDEVEFCSGHFVEYDVGKYVYVQKLRKLISSLTTCLNADAIRQGWVAQYYKSLGMMYKKLYGDIPIYKDVADFLLRTNTDSGLNINLIQSYNLLKAFENSEEAPKIINYSYALLSVSLVNDLSFAELDRISKWFRFNSLSVDAIYNRRCNLRNKKKDDRVPIIDYDSLNEQVLKHDPKRGPVSSYLKQLRAIKPSMGLRRGKTA